MENLDFQLWHHTATCVQSGIWHSPHHCPAFWPSSASGPCRRLSLHRCLMNRFLLVPLDWVRQSTTVGDSKKNNFLKLIKIRRVWHWHKPTKKKAKLHRQLKSTHLTCIFYSEETFFFFFQNHTLMVFRLAQGILVAGNIMKFFKIRPWIQNSFSQSFVSLFWTLLG